MNKTTLILCLTLATPALGAPPGIEFLDARALSMGGAVRTLADPTAAALLNPAALGPVRGFFGGTTYATRRDEAFDGLALTLVDNVTSPMGGSLQYLRLRGAEEREDLSLSLASGKRGLWWGFTVRYVQGRNPDGSAWAEEFNADLGFLFERPGNVRVAVVGSNLLDTSLDHLPRKVALAASRTGLGRWTVAADLVRNLEHEVSRGLDLHLGAEYAAGRAWTLRVGQLWRGDTGKDYASLGVGWAHKDALRFGYGLQRARQEAGELLHVLSLEGSF